MAIKIPPDTQKKLLHSIQRFMAEQYDLSLGEVNAAIFLEFCLKEIGPSVYNQAVADAQGVVQERVTELENICFEDEFGYWKPSGKRSIVRKPIR
jgi:uncharacterized protein (DUF2164 family)